MLMNPMALNFDGWTPPSESSIRRSAVFGGSVRHWPTRNVPIFGCASFFPDKNRPMPSFDKGGGTLGEVGYLGIVES